VAPLELGNAAPYRYFPRGKSGLCSQRAGHALDSNMAQLALNRDKNFPGES
jgi:hypothetical protein